MGSKKRIRFLGVFVALLIALTGCSAGDLPVTGYIRLISIGAEKKPDSDEAGKKEEPSKGSPSKKTGAASENKTSEDTDEASENETSEDTDEASESETAGDEETASENEASEDEGDEPQEEALDLWTDEAAAKNELVAYMEDVTEEESEDYIPEDDRIAVFDLDGTLFCETDPNYFDYCLLEYRVLDDPEYKDEASDFEIEVAQKIRKQNETGASFEDLPTDHGKAVASAFAGMTIDEFNDYIQEFKKQPMPGYTGMTRGEGFYRPMLQVIDYLEDNDFTVYIVSGTDRFIVRGIVDDSLLELPARQIIGSDESLVASRQGDEDGLDYTYSDGDKLVLGGDFLIKNLKMNKVSVIAQEIGTQPVLAFGNSTGDSSMLEYTVNDNQYKSLGFMLCCDDLERENGDTEKAEKMYDLCEDKGWTAISMKDDWTTIYGDGVERKDEEKLHASFQKTTDSPDWIKELESAKDEDVDQLLVVAGLGEDLTTATVSMHERAEDGSWKQILTTPGYVGRNGLCADEDHKEGCEQTPMGTYHFNKAFGIAEDPGCDMDYTRVSEDTYWSGDDREGMHYNEMVDISDLPDLDMENSEHIVDYEYEHQYCLNISFNEDGEPGRGSAIFLHCLGTQKPYTGGCVAIPEYSMKQVMQNVQEDCVVVIDTMENMGASF